MPHIRLRRVFLKAGQPKGGCHVRCFNSAKKGFEAHYKHDEELHFKAIARRNKLVGLWAAELLGFSGDAAKAYAKSVVAADFDAPNGKGVVAKILKDFRKWCWRNRENDIFWQLDHLYAVACKEVGEEFRQPLEKTICQSVDSENKLFFRQW